MTSGGHTMTEGWNLQLQGQVRDLEADLAEAERFIAVLCDPGNRILSVERTLARAFLKSMAAKREQAAAQAKDIDALLEQEGASEAEEQDKSRHRDLHPSPAGAGRDEDDHTPPVSLTE